MEFYYIDFIKKSSNYRLIIAAFKTHQRVKGNDDRRETKYRILLEKLTFFMTRETNFFFEVIV